MNDVNERFQVRARKNISAAVKVTTDDVDSYVREHSDPDYALDV